MSLHQISLSSSSSSLAMLQPRPCSATPVRGASTPGVTIRGGGGLCLLRMTSKRDRAAEAVVGQVTQVDKDTIWHIVSASGDKVVVLHMYTHWCGPCKMIAPKLKELSEKYLDVVFLKLDCNKENRPLAKELGLKVVPTFKILKDNKVVTEVTGAKIDKLIAAIDTVKSG